MNKSLHFSILFFLFLNSYGFSQQERKGILSFSAGIGVLAFDGDIGKGKDVTSYSYVRSGYTLDFEKRFAKNWLGASLHALTGKLAMAERSTTIARNNNFESSITQVGVNITAYLQNNKKIPLSPFMTLGFSYASLNAKTDIKYHGDSLYCYWRDGSIRNLPETPTNEFKSRNIKRDYIYETAINNAAKSAISIPVGGGIKMKISSKIEANIGLTYYFSLSDGIEGIQGKGKDKYSFSYFSVTYNFFEKSKDTKKMKTPAVDFSKIDKLDTDNDGVIDVNDFCPATPKDVKVNGKGCPLDNDGDGVPDYLDKEPDSKKGSVVDSNGKTITDAMILQKTKQDSLSSDRVNLFMGNSSPATLQNMDDKLFLKKSTPEKGSQIPDRFLSTDINKDGIISSLEITTEIGKFFEGSNNYSVEKLNALIDFFFEQ
jgi:opacity protein-like surface antigen